jgi:membrane protein YdbS with pleckstrin-like domain
MRYLKVMTIMGIVSLILCGAVVLGIVISAIGVSGDIAPGIATISTVILVYVINDLLVEPIVKRRKQQRYHDGLILCALRQETSAPRVKPQA